MNKEYKNRLEQHETAVDVTPSLHYVGIFGYESAYLDREAQKDLRSDIKDRKQNGHYVLDGTNNKATWYFDDDGGKVLRSYYTDVARLYEGRLYKLWTGYSATTMNHINQFLYDNGHQMIRKYDWIMIDEYLEV